MTYEKKFKSSWNESPDVENLLMESVCWWIQTHIYPIPPYTTLPTKS